MAMGDNETVILKSWLPALLQWEGAASRESAALGNRIQDRSGQRGLRDGEPSSVHTYNHRGVYQSTQQGSQ